MQNLSISMVIIDRRGNLISMDLALNVCNKELVQYAEERGCDVTYYTTFRGVEMCKVKVNDTLLNILFNTTDIAMILDDLRESLEGERLMLALDEDTLTLITHNNIGHFIVVDDSKVAGLEDNMVYAEGYFVITQLLQREAVAV